ncbi:MULTISPECIES: hypothetical protein [Campylobacter]|uniref:hypothetical protein n=1 Tax=Campylobacter TaxID=194 RepID=UPI00027A3A5C|nr:MULTISPECIES: hypothetical protein [Campylobacter]EJP75481.1 hypothetical protein HMPREF1139_0360 [Campylobacter sp. FOBRC14]
MIFGFQSEVKPCEATLSPPIFTSCYALVTRLRYEDREAIADRGLLCSCECNEAKNRAICSASCGVNRVCKVNVNDYHNGVLKFHPLIRYVLAKISQILDTICA